MNQIDFNEEFRNRTKQNAIKIISVVSDLPYTDAVGILRKQLIKAATSVAANFRAVCRARSENERFSKLCIVVEEADEVLLWIEIFVESGIIDEKKIVAEKKEAEEILKVMSAFKKTMQQKK